MASTDLDGNDELIAFGRAMQQYEPMTGDVIQSTMAASVVDLPDPVAPTRMTRPRLVMTSSLST